MRRKLHIKWLVWIGVCAVLCTGCGQARVDDTDWHNSAVDVLAVNPTIHSDDPGNENMAGLLQDAAKEVTVQIQMDGIGGSGVIWKMEDEQLVIATAAHVLAGRSQTAQITFADDFQVSTSDYVLASDADVAFLYVPLESIPQEQLVNYYRVNVDKAQYDGLVAGDILIAMGSVSAPGDKAYEGTLLESWIWVEDFNQYMMLAKLVADAGMSGGGVFNEEGFFMGILCGVNEDGEAAVLPWALMESVYEGL